MDNKEQRMKEKKEKDWRGYNFSMNQEGRDAIKYLQDNGYAVSKLVRKIILDKAIENGFKRSKEGEVK